jgi:hypothetical protein
VVLTGQDGFIPTGRAENPRGVLVRVCASGGTAGMLGRPGTVPRPWTCPAVRVSQATELIPPSARWSSGRYRCPNPPSAVDQVSTGWTRAQIGLLASVSRIRATSLWPGRRACSMRPGSTSTRRAWPRGTPAAFRRPSGHADQPEGAVIADAAHERPAEVEAVPSRLTVTGISPTGRRRVPGTGSMAIPGLLSWSARDGPRCGRPTRRRRPGGFVRPVPAGRRRAARSPRSPRSSS